MYHYLFNQFYTFPFPSLLSLSLPIYFFFFLLISVVILKFGSSKHDTKAYIHRSEIGSLYAARFEEGNSTQKYQQNPFEHNYHILSRKYIKHCVVMLFSSGAWKMLYQLFHDEEISSRVHILQVTYDHTSPFEKKKVTYELLSAFHYQSPTDISVNM